MAIKGKNRLVNDQNFNTTVQIPIPWILCKNQKFILVCKLKSKIILKIVFCIFVILLKKHS